MSVDREKFETLFHRAELRTRSNELVERVWLLPFQAPAEVVSWGQRVFVLDDQRIVDPDGREVLVYLEGMMTFTIDPDSGMLKIG